MYRPRNIADWNFSLHNDTAAILYAAERDILRLDERIKSSPCAGAVLTTLLRGDALSTQNIYNVFPDIYTVMRIETAGSLLHSSQDTNDAIKNLLYSEDHPTIDNALKIYRYMQTVEWVTDPNSSPSMLTPDDMLDVYRRCEFGPLSDISDASFRSIPFSFGKEGDAALYQPPYPNDLYPLLNDYCAFIRSDILTPLSQASIAQYQFEALKPFDSNLDRMERLIMHYILSRRGLLENITLPLNLFAAHFKDRFDKLLMPYLTKPAESDADLRAYVEDLITYMTQIAYEVIKFTISLHKMLLGLIDQWKARLGRVDKGSALELLLYEFAGTPIMTISQGLGLINRSFSTTSEAFERLESAGILRAGKPIRRNKTLEATEAILLHDAMYQKRATTYEAWTTLEKDVG